MHDGIADVYARYVADSLATFGKSLFDLNLALLTVAISIKLQGGTLRELSTQQSMASRAHSVPIARPA